MMSGEVGRRERCLLGSQTKKNNSPAKKIADGLCSCVHFC